MKMMITMMMMIIIIIINYYYTKSIPSVSWLLKFPVRVNSALSR